MSETNTTHAPSQKRTCSFPACGSPGNLALDTRRQLHGPLLTDTLARSG